jgi:glyoxylase-like metal-dependent hydrolase (beta-lactamase superfamily II)
MTDQRNLQNIRGIFGMFSSDPKWPSPANVYAIADRKGFGLIDVGCGGEEGLQRLTQGLDHWDLEFEALHTVVLSHAHPDHMGALSRVLERSRPTVFIHKLDGPLVDDPGLLVDAFDIPLAQEWLASTGQSGPLAEFDLLDYFDGTGCSMCGAEGVRRIEEGDVVEVGDFAFEVVHTPGHSPGHIALFDRRSRILFSGDLVGRSPAWYTPSSGGLTGYLESLDKLEALDAELILPSHGDVISEPAAAIRRIRSVLHDRESTLLEHLGGGPRTFSELNRHSFPSPWVRFFPGCGITESHILKLERDGIVRRDGGMIDIIRDN